MKFSFVEIDGWKSVLSDDPDWKGDKEIDLKPCPFCGCPDLRLWSSKWRYPREEPRQYYGIECKGCGASIYGTPKWAEKWNRRVEE